MVNALDFSFSDEHESFRRKTREFCEKRLKPRVKEIETRGSIPIDVIQGMADLGLLGMTVSPEFGGSGADPILAGIAGEEIARADISCATAVFFLVQATWGQVLDRYGKPELKETVLPKITKGKAFLGIASTEPHAGSDIAAIKTTAMKEGTDYVVNGKKMYISGVREAAETLEEGGGFLTLVKTAPNLGSKGLSFLYIPIRNRNDVSVTYVDEWGRRGISFGGFSLTNARVPGISLVGEENRGFYIAMQGFDLARAMISVVCCGAAASALEQGIEYIKRRRAFGQPIARYEGIQFKLAENYAKMEAIRLLGYKALWMLGKEQKDKDASRFETTRVVAEAKMLAPAMAFEAMNDIIQWYGAFGYTTECPIALGLKGVRSYLWAEGSNEIMKIIVARELLGKEYVTYR